MDDLVLTIEYNKDASNPEQYFYAVAKMIEGLKIIDSEVSRCIEKNLDTEIVLSDIEKGSIKIFLKTTVKKTEKLVLSIDEEHRVKKVEEIRNITNGRANTYRVLEVKQIIPQILDDVNLFGEDK